MLFDISGSRPKSTEDAFKGMEKMVGQASPGQIQRLEMNLGKALMICEALWELLRDKAKLTQDDLYKKLYEIDMRDGALDGQNQPKVRDCPACHRPVSGRHAACLYCGHVLDESVFKMD